jgi:glycosyltransferase involved in cell wall biosynthesis
VKLAVFSGQYFWFDGKHYSTDEAFVKFITSFCPYFEKIILCDAVMEEKETEAYVLDPTKAEVWPLPHFSVYSFWRNILSTYPKIYRLIRDNMNRWDILWLNAPHPVSLMFAHICRKLGKPFFLFIRQNLKVQVGYRNRGIMKILSVAAATMLEWIFRWLSRDCLTFAVGEEIFQRYRKTGKSVHKTAVSLISKKDIPDTVFERTPRDPRQTRLLSVGRLDPEKGIIYLIQAVDKLVANGNADIILDIVGTGTEENGLRWQVSKRGLAQNVHFAGYVSHGRQLLNLYRESDVYIQPSLTEGWPQTLFEAMACGVPVVATRVGGIPYLIEDGENGLLIDPASPREISDAVKRLVSDAELKDRIVRNGFVTARNHTLEVEREKMMGHINRFLDDGCRERNTKSSL